MNKTQGLKRLLQPKSIALFGGDESCVVIQQCRKIGFNGEYWPVNPHRSDIEGVPCFRSAAELPSAPDASFIGVGPQATISLLRELNAMGAGGAVCYASGFAEIGGSGIALQEQLLEAAGDMAVVGPNCHGLINYVDGVALWPDQHGGVRGERGVAFVLQSGNVGISISMQQRSLGISHLITVGNKADLDLHDYINVLLDDPRVSAIGLHIEGMSDVVAFSRAAIRALEMKIPIVALKTGTSEIGTRTAMSHTSSLAGSDELYSALFKRLGIARCETMNEFLETLKFLSVIGALPGNTVASMSCSGGEASMVADQADVLGLEMPAFSAEIAKKLHDILGEKVHIENPLDYHTYIWGDCATMAACFSAVLSQKCDANILVIDYPREGVGSAEMWEIAEDALIEACRKSGRRAVIMSSLAENLPAKARARLLDAGIAPMQGLKECMLAIRAAAEVGAAQICASTILPIANVDAAPDESRFLNEWESKLALSDFGLSVPQGAVCDADEVEAAAAEIGYPVCLKIASGQIAHKSDIGGVQLDLKNDNQVRKAQASMNHLGSRFLVEKMVQAPVAELIVGIKRDAQFGLALVIGAGGLLVELVDDATVILLPASGDDIAEALGRLRIAKVLAGFRGGPAADLPAAIDAIGSVAEFALSNKDRLLELDVNPLLVLADGQGAVAADALIRLATA